MFYSLHEIRGQRNLQNKHISGQSEQPEWKSTRSLRSLSKNTLASRYFTPMTLVCLSRYLF